ncbi:Craniofacial development protein 2, partial [Varanus komodoensis]
MEKRLRRWRMRRKWFSEEGPTAPLTQVGNVSSIIIRQDSSTKKETVKSTQACWVHELHSFRYALGGIAKTEGNSAVRATGIQRDSMVFPCNKVRREISGETVVPRGNLSTDYLYDFGKLKLNSSDSEEDVEEQGGVEEQIVSRPPSEVSQAKCENLPALEEDEGFKGKPFNITVVQVYAPTTGAEEAEVDRFYEGLQHLLELTPKNDVLIIMGDRNAKVGSQKITGITSKFGLGVQNEAGHRLVEFCQENTMLIANTLFQQPKRRLYTWTSPD